MVGWLDTRNNIENPFEKDNKLHFYHSSGKLIGLENQRGSYLPFKKSSFNNNSVVIETGNDLFTSEEILFNSLVFLLN
jgi:hypothetical protein